MQIDCRHSNHVVCSFKKNGELKVVWEPGAWSALVGAGASVT